jgi:hypothetical protein
MHLVPSAPVIGGAELSRDGFSPIGYDGMFRANTCRCGTWNVVGKISRLESLKFLWCQNDKIVHRQRHGIPACYSSRAPWLHEVE